jgi:hypothetical protein
VTRTWTFELEGEADGSRDPDDDREAEASDDVLQLDEGGLCAFSSSTRDSSRPEDAPASLHPLVLWKSGGRWLRCGDHLGVLLRSADSWWPGGTRGHLTVFEVQGASLHLQGEPFLTREHGEDEPPEEGGCTPAHRAILGLPANVDEAAAREALEPVEGEAHVASESGITPLMLACAHGAAPVLVPALLALLDEEAAQAADDRGWTALHWLVASREASSSPPLELVRALVSAGADPEATDGQGQTPLQRLLGGEPLEAAKKSAAPDDAQVLELLAPPGEPSIEETPSPSEDVAPPPPSPADPEQAPEPASSPAPSPRPSPEPSLPPDPGARVDARAAVLALAVGAGVAAISILALSYLSENWMQQPAHFWYSLALLALGSFLIPAHPDPEIEEAGREGLSPAGAILRAGLLLGLAVLAEQREWISLSDTSGGADAAAGVAGAFLGWALLGRPLTRTPAATQDHLTPIVARQDRAFSGCATLVLIAGAGSYYAWELGTASQAFLGVVTLVCALVLRGPGLNAAERAEVWARSSQSGLSYPTMAVVVVLFVLLQWPEDLRTYVVELTDGGISRLRRKAEAATARGDLAARAEAQWEIARKLVEQAAGDQDRRTEVVEAFADVAVTEVARGDVDAMLRSLDEQIAAHEGRKP